MDLELVHEEPVEKRDVLWDALMEACNVDTASVTDWARGRYNKSLSQLRKVRATPADVIERAAEFRKKYPALTISPSRLCQKWPELKPKRESSHMIVKDGEVWQQGTGWSKL